MHFFHENQGSWEATTVYYKGNVCVDNQESYRTTFLGTYQLGEESEIIAGFTNIEYRLSAKQMQIFTEDMLEYVNSLHSCSIKETSVEQFVNVRHADCYPLQLVPIENVKIIFHLVYLFFFK